MSEQEEMDERHKRRRRLLARRTQEAIAALLTNPDGLRRLREISDEEWQEAVDADANEGA